MLDFIRMACGVPKVTIGNVSANVEAVCSQMAQADQRHADVLVFPELCLTGYTCGDLFLQDSLWQGVKEGLKKILAKSKESPAMTVVVGAPVRLNGKLLNCALTIRNGDVLGIVCKTYLDGEEGRWFWTGSEINETSAQLDFLGLEGSCPVSVGADLLIPLADEAVLGVEICEDLNAPIPVSSMLALSGANVIVNLAASNATAGKAEKRERRVKHQSAVCHCVYAYCSAGSSESTSDTVYSGHSIIAENGKILATSGAAPAEEYLLVADCDLGRANYHRRGNPTFRRVAGQFADRKCQSVPVKHDYSLRSDGSLYPLRKLVFVPEEENDRAARCMEVFNLQVTGLKRRLQVINAKAVIGVSGGLDSTLALLVAAEAMRQLGRPMTDVYGITMPCFGTSDRTYRNAWELMKLLGINSKEIRIADAVTQHFADIEHDITNRNTTYENAQARERTQILMDYAGKVGGIVVGTGDMSELALGWCTYNGDHMSMYGVNAGVPKSLIPFIIDTVAKQPQFCSAAAVLADILETPISPELLPPDQQGKIAQQTEDIVGPYALHDFFLYHMLRYGFSPKKIHTLACRAFAGEYDAATIKKWLTSFYRRFFTQQFKRNCMPDGVKIGSVSLSPRGDWRMPSDASGRLWLSEVEKL